LKVLNLFWSCLQAEIEDAKKHLLTMGKFNPAEKVDNTKEITHQQKQTFSSIFQTLDSKKAGQSIKHYLKNMN